MNLTDIIVIAVIVLIVGSASFYIYKSKKAGKGCIGCPDSCNGRCNGCNKCIR